MLHTGHIRISFVRDNCIQKLACAHTAYSVLPSGISYRILRLSRFGVWVIVDFPVETKIHIKVLFLRSVPMHPGVGAFRRGVCRETVLKRFSLCVPVLTSSLVGVVLAVARKARPRGRARYPTQNCSGLRTTTWQAT